MKTEFRTSIMAATVALGAALIMGCATMERGYDDAAATPSALAFTPVTDPEDLVKWTGTRFQEQLRSVDTYYFVVPDTRYTTGPGWATAPARPLPDSQFRDAAGMPGPYQYDTGGYRIIRHQPGHQR
jgi:hypothetical protein